MAAGMKRVGFVAGAMAGVCALVLCGCDDPKQGASVAGVQSTPSTGAQPPAEPKPAVNPKMNEPLPTEDVTIKGRTFKLELAVNADTRLKGLSFRESIPADGGMLFVFPRPVTTSFVMRDCPVPIDIIYLDGTGRVVSAHKMVPEPRTPGEADKDYEERLKKYPSGYDTQYVIELKGSTLDTLDVKKGDKIKLDLPKLKKMAK